MSQGEDVSGGSQQQQVAACAQRVAVGAGPCATFNIQPPESFDFSKPQEWDKWIRRFERFCLASNLNASSEENQVNTLIYCMGDEADDILRGLTLTAAERGTYKGVRDGFQRFFVVKKNVIYERAKFNMRKQSEGESVDSFVTALYALAERCNYGVLHDELIRDRLMVGLLDKGLSERMQLDAELTLDKAVRMARQSEEVKKQQASLRGDTREQASDAKSVDRVRILKNSKPVKNKPQYANKPHSAQYSKRNHSQSQCHKCGSSPPHSKHDCPAREVKCHACGRKGHYSRMCRAPKSVHEVGEEEDAIFLGSITSKGDPWMVDINIHDTRVMFKIDTGADVTVLPHTVFLNVFKGNPPRLYKASKPLLGPGRSPLDVVGITRLLLRRGEKEVMEDLYVVRHLHTALLGRSASCRLGLVARLDSVTVEILKQTYPKLCSGLGEMRQPYTIKLKPGAQPFSLKTPRRIPLPLVDKVKQELSRMEDLGVICRIEEPTDWCAGIVVVPKKSGGVRLCVDLTKLNESACREKFILPSVEETLGMLAGVSIFSRTQEEHDTRLHAALTKIQKAGITLNIGKCDLSKSEVSFLGHVVSANGISPDPGKTEAVRKMQEPTTVSELRSFLGMVNQLGKFIPQLAERDKPLCDLLSKKNCWMWGVNQANAFLDLKNALTSPPVLAMYNPNRECKVSDDASSYGLGGVLLQKWDKEWRPIAYMSQSLTPTEQRYAQVEKEALGLTWACERFRNFLIGKHFQLETDHKPLLSLLGSQALDALPPRIQRFRMRLMRYSYSISHVSGKCLWTADTLTRAPLKRGVTPADKELFEDTNIYIDMVMENLPASTAYLEELKDQLQRDSVCARVMQLCTESWPVGGLKEPALKFYWAERALLTVQDGLLLKGQRLVIPSTMRNDVLAKLHEGHQGVVKCRERARQSVWWPGLSQQLNELVLNCRACCQERLNHREPLISTPYLGKPWQKCGADLFMLGSKTYLLVVDYMSRYVEIALLTPTRSNDVIHHLKSIFAHHGICETLVTDNGPQFSGAAFSEFAASYGFCHVTSSPKYPQGNAEAEQAVQTVKGLLKKSNDPYLALLAYRATPLQNGYSPAQLLMGRRLHTTVHILPALLVSSIRDKDKVMLKERERKANDAQRYNQQHRARNLHKLVPGQDVWITDQKATGAVIGSHTTPRSYLVEGPHRVIRRNRHHLIAMQPSPEQISGGTAEGMLGGTPERPPTVQPAVAAPQQNVPEPPSTPALRTRSRRAVVKPTKLNL
ncbi:hypothetical protein SRHO_G00112410 [Serrasalmus rhombeus]